MTGRATSRAVAPPPGPLEPGDGVHVWIVALDVDAARLAAMREDLAPSEHAALARIEDPTLARRFVVRRAALRRALARTVGGAPKDVAIVRPVGMAPRLDGGGELRFSASDSADLAIVAVARAAVGVDVEAMREVERAREIAPRYFDAAGAARVAAAVGDAVPGVFLREWTRLEAVAKATDGGVFRHVARRARRGDGGDGVRVVELALLPGFVGCVASAARGPVSTFVSP
jgi:4'-phosphopantetheinyl transferase